MDNSCAALFTVSDSGLLAYARGASSRTPRSSCFSWTRTGRSEPLPGFDRPLATPQIHFSPDGRQLVFTEQGRSGLLWLFDVERQTFLPLSDRGIAGSPRWSPDGDRAGGVLGGGRTKPPLDRAHRSGRLGAPHRRGTRGLESILEPGWRLLAFVREGPPSTDILLYRFEDRQVVPFLTTEAYEAYPEFSPDGRWLAYASDESGRTEVYVTSFPGREQTITVSRQGGRAPAWSRDGRRLFYYSNWSREKPAR